MSMFDSISKDAEGHASDNNVRLCVHKVPFGAGNDMEITDLYADTPNNGDGSRSLQFLCDLADKHNCNLYLHPECERNKVFYGRFGFIREPVLKYSGLQLVRYSVDPEADN